MKLLKTDRSILSYVLLSFVTCGIYSIYYWYCLTEDLNTVAGRDGKESPNYIIVCLLSFITFGFYQFYWIYKQGNRLQEVIRDQGGDCNENGTTYLMWTLLGLVTCSFCIWYCYHLFFKNMNTACANYNNGGDNPTSSVDLSKFQ